MIGAEAEKFEGSDLKKNESHSPDKSATHSMTLEKTANWTCPSGETQCGNTTECIAKDRICDGLPDCANEYDEYCETHLGRNGITDVHQGMFDGLYQLQKLDLGNNEIKTISEDLFQFNTKLATLEMRHIYLDNISTSIFAHMTALELAYFAEFGYCSYAPQVRYCEPKNDGISSTQDLLDSPLHRSCIWIVAILTCTGNIFVFIGRIIAKDENPAQSLYVKNLCASDLLIGVYLILIGAHDVKFRSEYNRHARKWLTSWTCEVTGFLATFPYQVSLLILTCMAVERYLRITFPYSTIGECRHRYLVLTLLWIIGITFASIPFISKDLFGNFYGRNGMCLPLTNHGQSQYGWWYSSFLFFGINVGGMVVLIWCYIGMFISIKRTREGARADQTGELAVAMRFSLIVVTNLICGIPIATVNALAILGTNIPANVLALIIVFFLPINCAINPILYSVSTVAFRKHLMKIVSKKRHRKRKSRAESSTSVRATHHSVLVDRIAERCRQQDGLSANQRFLA
ncbi:relaxin receptor 2-like [Tubulanus polymorphus]|uniref:relaxin receptor 2-like n=1 Tax=Tubulanus polymorphus TaxID=672921 RepID=UPI003DA326D5